MSQECENCWVAKKVTEDLNKLEKQYSKLNSKVSELDKNDALKEQKIIFFETTIRNIQEGINRLIEKIDMLEKKPIGRIDKISAAIIGGVITYLLNQLLSKVMGG